MKSIFTFLIGIQLLGCSLFEKKKEIAEYVAWINEDSHGFVKKKYINGLEITVKYLPSEYLAYQELRNEKKYSEQRRDSLIDMYNHNLTFLISVATDEREKSVGDVMYKDLKDMEGYKERMQTMNFEMQEFLELKTGDKSYHPVLTNMENTYGLSSGRNITCVFSPLTDKNEFSKAEEFDLIWDDDLFGSGRNHFVFMNKDFSTVPGLKF